MTLDLDSIKDFKRERYDDLHRFGKAIQKFFLWQYLEYFPENTILPTIQNSEFRVKSDDSLARNVKEHGYSDVHKPGDISDLVGTRLIVYFDDDIRGFLDSTDLESVFGKEANDSYGEKSGGNGYRSFHFIVTLDSNSLFYKYLRESDKKAFLGLKCEVQARTIIQHAFAESNHQLNYKYPLYIGEELPISVQNEWSDASDSLDQVDKKISALKKKYESEFAMSDRKPEHGGAKFEYLGESSYSSYDCFDFEGVRYGYVMLIRPPIEAYPVVEIDETFFDINKKFLATGVSGISESYKKEMWEKLEKNRPDAIGRITFDSMVPRVVDWDGKDGGKLKVQRAMYSDQVVSNHKFALNEEIPGTNTKVRELAFAPDGSFKSFADSPFSNTIGVCCVVKTADSKWVLSHRGANVAFDPGVLGCSTSGALEWDELGQWGTKDFLNWFAGGLVREYQEELGVDADDLGESLIFLGFGREIDRCGKPQAFFLIEENSLKFDELKQRWRIYADSVITKENQAPEFVDISGVSTETLQKLISADVSIVLDAISEFGGVRGISEELRANVALALEYYATQ